MTLRPRDRSTGTARCDSMCGSARNTTSATSASQLGVEVVKRQLGEPAQMRIDAGQRLAGQTLGGHAGERHPRVREQEAQQLGAHVPAGAGDGNAKAIGSRHGTQRLEYWNFCRAPG